MVERDRNSLIDEFHELEKQCIGFENYINTDDEHYSKTLEGLKKVIEQIKKDHIFS
jgi:hypothetical protein